MLNSSFVFRRACDALAIVCLAQGASAAAIIFDDFNTGEGHFASAASASGSNANILATSTADQLTDTPFEGAGYERLVINPTTTGAATRLRFLSGGAAPANNIAFTTSAADDGWIGFYARTSATGWTAQIWLEGAENNGSVQRTLIDDGAWHLYEWNLDDQTGGADGWGAVAGVVAGDADFQDGSYTIDSILFRHTGPPGSATIDFDFVAKSNSGSVAGLIPEPSALALLAMIWPAMARRRRR